MKIAVIGAGAMGSVYAGLLAAAGNEVWAVDLDAGHIAAIRADGLRISGASGERTVALEATCQATDAAPVDLAIIATKASGVAAAACSAAGILAPDGLALTIQNGMGSADRAAAVIGGDRLLVGIAGGFGASLPAPGHVRHEGWAFVRIGEYGGGGSARLDAVAAIWADAGFRVEARADIERMIWEKFICNVAYSAPCTLTGLTIGEVAADGDAFDVSLACAREALAVAYESRIPVEIDDLERYIRQFARNIPDARPSMLLDHLARRRSEIEVLNGAVPELAGAVGLGAPANTVVTQLIRARESLFP